jgi:hypothetical protein
MHYQRVIDDLGFAQFPTPVLFGRVMGVLHFSMYLFGTLATIYFMRSYQVGPAGEP